MIFVGRLRLTGFCSSSPEAWARGGSNEMRGKEKCEECLRSLRLGVLLIALAVTGAMALAQEQDQQMPIVGQGMHGTMGQQTDQSMMGGCPMMGRASRR